jgi:hypothetical protein
VSVTPYVLCGAGSFIQFGLSSDRLDPPLYTLPIHSIYSLPSGPKKRLTALSVNVAPDEGRQLASGARPPSRVLRCGPRLSPPGVLPEGPRDAPRSLPGSVRRLGSFMCVARGHRHSSPCLSDVMGGASGGGHPTASRQTTRHDPGGKTPFVPVATPPESTHLLQSCYFYGEGAPSTGLAWLYQGGAQ